MSHRAGLVGAGYISEYHVAALRRRAVEITGIFDVDPAAAARTADRLGLRAFDSIEALRDAGASVIHVLTPPHTHATVALEALRLGCHVLVEKPLAVEVEDCRRIEEMAARMGLQVCVNHSLLFDPQVRRALDAVRRGKIGQVVSVDILRSSAYPPYAGGPLPPQFRTAGYPFRDLGVHALYLCEALLGPIQDVQASWKSLGGEPNLAFDEWRAQVQCRDGLGQFQLSWNVRPMQSQMIIQGTRGVLRVDLFLMFQALRAATPLPKPIERVVNALTDSVRPLVEVPRGILGFLRGKVLPYHGLQDLVAAFYDSLDSRTPVPVSAGDARRVVRWTEEIARAADAEHQARTAALPVSDTVPYLVTGASGAVGRQVVRALLERGERVRIFVRRVPADVPDGVEVVLGDLGDPAAVDRAVRGARIVIHAGAAMKGGAIEHQCATVTGTRNVVDACRRHRVEKLVHVSSLSVVDWASGDRASVISEATPLEPRPRERGAYTNAKLEAEKLVSEGAAEGLPAVILRPGQIYGGGIPLVTPAVARRVGGRWLVLGDGRIPLPLVEMGDVVEATLRAASGSLRGGEIIQVVGPEALTQNDVLRLTGSDRQGVLRIPRPLVFLAGRLSELLLRPLGRQSPLSAYRLRSALSRHRFESTACMPLLGWTPQIDLRGRSAGEHGSGSTTTWPPAGSGPEPAGGQVAAEAAL